MWRGWDFNGAVAIAIVNRGRLVEVENPNVKKYVSTICRAKSYGGRRGGVGETGEMVFRERGECLCHFSPYIGKVFSTRFL